MDDIFLPDEDDALEADASFEKISIESEKLGHPSGVDASDYVKITFDRFVTLVANHSFLDVVERNEKEEVILSTNLLTDLANARGFRPNTRGPLMVLGGVVLGLLIGYYFF